MQAGRWSSREEEGAAEKEKKKRESQCGPSREKEGLEEEAMCTCGPALGLEGVKKGCQVKCICIKIEEK